MSQPTFPKELQKLWWRESGSALDSLNPRDAFPEPDHRHQPCFEAALRRQEEIQILEEGNAKLRAQATQPVPSLAELLRELADRMNQLGQQLGQQLKECPGQVQELQERITPLDWFVPDSLLADGNIDEIHPGETRPQG